MRNNFMDISQLLNLDEFQQLQEDISLATGLAIITIDHTGSPITAHSRCTEFCQQMRESKDMYSLCEKCDARGGLEAVRIHDPYIYLCHAGIVSMAIPIIVKGLYIGAFIAGQVHVKQTIETKSLEHLLSSANTIDLINEDSELVELYNKIPRMTLAKIKANANMLNYFANLCIERSLHNLTKSEKLNTKNIMIQTTIPSTLENSNKASFKLLNNKTSNSYQLIQPSLNYIKTHLNEKITLSKMAALCNISPSYYSRLFAKQNLGNLSNYVNQLKVEHAKKILTSTDLTVNSIAETLGFDDSGYFIKQFKLHTGTTPIKFKYANKNLRLK